MDRRVCKVLLLGEGGVGKTSLVRRFVSDEFSDDYISTIGTKVTRKDVQFPEIELSMMLWDIHGQRSITPLHKSNYRGANGALMVFDVTRKDTFEYLQQWIEDLFEITGKIPIVALGNKFDIISNVPRTREELDSFLLDYEGNDLCTKFTNYLEKSNPGLVKTYEKDLGIEPSFELVLKNDIAKLVDDSGHQFMFTSAKDGMNVEEAFKTLAEKIMEDENDE